MKRRPSIDVVRGVVMIIMALDHVRDLLHVDALAQQPTNLATTTPVLFFTRWITHLCAPTFVFLAGTAAYLSWRRSGDLAQSRKFLIKRGLWLILLEFTLVNFALWFDPKFHILLFQVIATIGCGFVVLGLLLRLPPKTLGIIGLVLIFCHNLLPLLPLGAGIRAGLTPLFGPASFPLTAQHAFIMGYPPLPWLGIMLAGFAGGQLFELDAERRRQLLIRMGLASLALFVALRFSNIYGDPVPWTAQRNALYTFLSFNNVTKYPPSLLFCLTMLGLMLLLLAWAENARNKFTEIAAIYGRVPLFYFLGHLYLIHLVLLGVLFWQGFHWADLDFASGTFGRPKGAVSGVGLGAVYLLWLGVVAAMYLPCRWYGDYKARHKEKTWLRYL